MMIKRLFNRMVRIFYISDFEKEYLRWVQDEGDKTLRLDYDLNENSLVWDLGGYVGEFAADMYCRYSCHVVSFEPIDRFADVIKKRFLKSTKIRVEQCGLGDKAETIDIGLSDDATSIFKAMNTVKCQLLDVHEFYIKEGSPEIDLMKINIEGGEYSVLNRAVETGMISKVKNIQVQFHNFVPDAEKKYEELVLKLSRTHKLAWSYRFIWENWERK